jgi:DNA-binding Xre family transcriptional regulator
MALDYEWRLRVLMAENGMFKAIDLAPRLAEHGIRLSDSQVWRLVTGRPERLNLRLMVVLCEILGCEPGELVKTHGRRGGRGEGPSEQHSDPRRP